MKNRWLTVAFVSMLSVCALAQSPTDTDSDEINRRGLLMLQQFNQDTRGLQGKFVQRVSRNGEAGEFSEGRFRLQRPGKFVWTYETPDEQIIVADGLNLWNYDVLLDQVDVRPQDEALADSPATILSGGADPLEAFDYHGSFEQEGLLWVQLAPRTEESDFGVLRLGFRDGLLAGMQLGDNLDQVTLIEFEDVVDNPNFEDEDFAFDVPEGVDVYGTPASDTERQIAAPLSAVSGKLRETLRYKRLWWILTVVVTVAALHELLRPGNEIILQFGFAPVMHLVGFGLLALWYCSLASAKRRLAVVIWLVFIGVGSEFAQHYMGLGRSGDWRDAIANMVGIGIGLAISLTIVGKWPFWVEWFLPSRGANQ